MSMSTIGSPELEPQNLQEALTSSDKSKWIEAMKNEYDSLVENQVWKLVDKPSDRNVVQCKWVYKLKNGGDNVRYKARLVAKGYSQSYGIDYFETFSPVARLSTVRMLIALSVQLDLNIDHFDVTTAFLHGDLQEQVYMTQPGFFVKPGQEAKVCLLQKAIYGLKQSSRAWNKKVNEILKEIGYNRSKIEPCLFWKKFQNNSIVIIILYVDDFYVFHNNSCKKNELFLKLQKEFKIKDLGEAYQCLGMKITRDRTNCTLYLEQKDYILSFLSKFGMSDAKGANTPMDAKVTIGRGSGERVKVPYQNVIGCLMYLSLCTRPDIAHVTNVLSQFNCEHTIDHWNHVKRVLRYLKSTSNYKLCFQKDSNLNLTGFVDASWGSDPDDRRSYTGFVFKLANGPISWESRKQRSVALSSAEAELFGNESSFPRRHTHAHGSTSRTAIQQR